MENPDRPAQDSDIGRFLHSDTVHSPEERAAIIEEFNTERLSKCISSLLLYRLVDIILATEVDFRAYGQGDRLAIPLPQKMVRLLSFLIGFGANC